ncbi:MAG: NAD(P)-binding domain-containing protein [Thermoleophilia bacterium]|nr:NAD(P)-binding domain-containing protein [Thermoleophilia bacterium]
MTDTLIIGGGQAGLATAYHLTRAGRDCLVLDEGERVGDSWRRRWPSLRLYSPARYDGLPGMPFPAPRHSFPTGREMADYLEAYARRFELPVRTGVQVESLERDGDRYVAVADGTRYEAWKVIVATGGFRDPFVPAFAGELDRSIRQLHSHDYRGPEQLQEGRVLVVGAAHSGGDIAFELAQAGHETLLSGRDTGQIPFRLEGRAMKVVFPVLRFMWTRVLTVRTPIGRKARRKMREHGGPLLRVKNSDLRDAGVERVARVAGVTEGTPVLEDGRVVEIANVVWCTGFHNDYSWIRIPLPLGEDGYPEQTRGAVAGVPGLYFVGLKFQHSFASTLILGAVRDAEQVANQIAA